MPGGQVARQIERPVTHADQAAHLPAERLEKPPHLALATFPQHNPVPAVGCGRLSALFRGNAVERRAAIVEMDAAPQFFKIAGGQRAVHPDRVLALDAVAGVHQRVRQRPGIRE